jgi:hypothetical protein
VTIQAKFDARHALSIILRRAGRLRAEG